MTRYECLHCGVENHLRPHCESPTCSWRKCTECEAVMTAKNHHYHPDDRHGQCAGRKK